MTARKAAPPTALADKALLAAIRRILRARADATKAGPMQSYMKSTLPYLGVQAPVLRQACREVFLETTLTSLEQWQATVLALWRSATHREERYAAIELSGWKAYRRFQSFETLPLYEEIITTGAWWDYVDVVAVHRVGPLLRHYPGPMAKSMRAWSRSPDLWKRRSSILCQLSFKRETDIALLHSCIEPSMDSREFFLRKGIGWALREYAKTDPREVIRYVRAHKDRLSPLTKREALRNVVKLGLVRAVP